MTSPPHRLFLASAGTGKTFQLSGHFLRRLFAGVKPECVLATTFTRKAAGEILDRVFRRLLEAIEKPHKLEELVGAVGRDVTAADCAAMLAHLARRLDAFQVRTLDSFFVYLARVFALDLGLPPDWTMVDVLDDAELRVEAIGRILEASEPQERVELLRGLQREGAARSVHDAMLRVVAEARSLQLESDAQAWRGPSPPEPGADLSDLVGRLATAPLPLTKAGAKHKSWGKAVDAIRACAEAEDWDGVLSSSLVQRSTLASPDYHGHPLEGELREVLAALGRTAAVPRVEEVARQTRAARRFLERFDEAYGALKFERAQFRFEDLPPLLSRGGPWGQGDLESIWFRLDERLEHLLLDEFQDTAPEQWRALERLAEEVLADGTGERSLFCVGDVKQSIYGWRAAEPRLLEELPRRYPVLVPETLQKSYRSSRVVLGAVNGVFGALDRSGVFEDEGHPGYGEARARWTERFEEHEAALELPGRAVLLEASPRADEESGPEACLRTGIERVAALAREAPQATIAVLVRTTAPIPRILHELRRAGVRASGEGGNPLTDAESVQVFLSALQLADHPSDTAAAFHVARSPLAGALGLEREEERLDAARELRGRLVREGYGAVVSGLLEVVENAPSFGAWDRRRFRQLVDLAHAHDARAGLRPAAFSRLVRETSVEDPTASRVRVMTIHGSKGLEFDAVVLPQTAQSMIKFRSAFWHDRADPFGPVERVSATPPKEVVPFCEDLSTLRGRGEARVVDESLSVLYVAMTRAARCLEIIVPPLPASGKPSTARQYDRLLRETLGAGEPVEPGVLWRHPDSTDDWHVGCGQEEEEHPVGAAEATSLGLAPTTHARSLPSRSPSAQEGGAPNAGGLLRPISAAAATHGKLVHRWLEELEWLEGFDRDRAKLLALGARIEPDEVARRRALDELLAALERPGTAALLSEPEDAGALEVLRERSLAQVRPEGGGGEALWIGTIDRLVLRRDGERVVCAEVIDYKTDAVDLDGVEARTEHYRPQLDSYREMVADAFGLEHTDVRARIAFLTPGVVAEV